MQCNNTIHQHTQASSIAPHPYISRLVLRRPHVQPIQRQTRPSVHPATHVAYGA
ncbi:hypothetical protein B0I35DRAFT_444621 [Stachybotrys elegans]|uniref:Uncharacterized protein n=1 Tax=Stachybotrys elegans TaxID=80388 RepID=A0A8K0SAS9_9HYPO|nr:hypothetical protein B0I35DRAFT_444621 [Stachybotrys elegans]